MEKYSTLKRFFEPALKNKKLTFLLILEGLSFSILGIISAIFIGEVTEILSNGKYEDLLKMSKLYFLGFFLYLGITFFTAKNGWVKFIPNIQHYLFKNSLKDFVELDGNQTEKTGTGKLVHMISSSNVLWSEFLTDILQNIGLLLPIFLYFIYRIFNLSFLFGILFIGFLIGIFTFILFIEKKVDSIRSKKYELQKIVTKNIVKITMSKFEILQNEKINEEVGKISAIKNEVILLNQKQNTWTNILRRGIETIISVLKIGIVLFVGKIFYDGNISLAEFVTFLALFLIFEELVKSCIELYRTIGKKFGDIKGLWEFFDTTPKIKGYDEGNTFKYKNGNIKIENINYEYSANSKVFDNFSCEINGGKITAFVGSSGGGKSTLIKLIAGYLRPDSGEIIIDQQKLSEISLKSYYPEIGYLTQEPNVFDGTIKENLLYALSEKDLENPSLEENIKKAILLAKCEFIYDLENGIETEIGERGVRLSGGQKQRLAIAKIFLKNPKIIILDEPTSALDSFSEEQITLAMHELFKGRTVLIIAHRLQTVKNADEIIVVKDGKIIERGNHNSLSAKNGFYKKMIDLQSGF